MEKIIVGADHAGYRLKQHLAEALKNQGYTVEDVGCFSEASVDYPQIGQDLAMALREAGPSAKGVLCCGSGVGISMSANRFPWVRAVLAHDQHTATMSRRHNDANVICMGGRIIAPELALEVLNTWLATPFDGGRHQKRIDLMSHIGNGAPSC